jgi:hypothetical protein
MRLAFLKDKRKKAKEKNIVASMGFMKSTTTCGSILFRISLLPLKQIFRNKMFPS